MDLETAFPSKYLKASDIMGMPNGRCQLAIAQLKMEPMKTKQGEDETKPVLYFRGAQKGLVLNKTNSERIAKGYGWESDQWAGRQLILYTAEVEAFGETVDAIRVILPPEERHASPAPDPTAPVPQTEIIQQKAEELELPPVDEEIPF